jgi:methyl-accepting chemotaxis protein
MASFFSAWRSHHTVANDDALVKPTPQAASDSALNALLAVATLAADGTLVSVSPAFAKLLGTPVHDYIGAPYQKLQSVYKLGSDRPSLSWSNLRQGQVQQDVFHYQSPTGATIWLETVYSPLLQDNKLVQVVLQLRDVTESHQRQHQQQMQANAFAQTFAMITFTPQGQILEANSNFVRALGYSSANEVVGQHHRMFCTDRFYQENPNFWQRLAKGEAHSGLFQRVSKTGKTVWIQESSIQKHDETGAVRKIIKIAVDVTGRIERQQAVQQAATIAQSTAHETSQVSLQGVQILQRNMHNREQIAAGLLQTSQLMIELNQQSTEIGKIVTTIKSIAEQTNLLALNAAIEAARAGQHGRGFAVVADEVRSLANRTRQSTQEIYQMVDKNSQLVNQANFAMQAVSDNVSQNGDLIAQASVIIEEILKGADYVSSLVADLVDSSQYHSS